MKICARQVILQERASADITAVRNKRDVKSVPFCVFTCYGNLQSDKSMM